MSFWEGILLVVAVNIAVRSLVLMMRRRTAQHIIQVQRQFDAYKERELERKRRERRQQAQNAA